MIPVLVDTGPLVAMLRRNDENHQLCRELAKEITRPLLTCWPVLTEAAYLLRYDIRHVQALLRYVTEDELEVAELPPKETAEWCANFFSTYSDHEPQLADATLVYLAEQEEITDIFTLDRRDFSMYRLSDGRAFSILG